ncbi:hypothetical protein Tco_1286860 [Tanacetum coccineum]
MATCHHLSGATWRKPYSVTVGQPPPDHRSMVVNDGSQRWSTAVNTTRPPVNGGSQRRWTTVDHRRTTGQRWRSTTVNGGRPPLTTVGPPVNQRVMAGYWVGSGRVMGQVKSGHGPGRIGSGSGLPRGTTWQLT